ncbi:hypothetical protein JAO76_06200 [Pontibacter sp. BT310]|jgi:hypothetical protein|uniref:Uncharacterized protein n=1 Tax=Pontibacter populi TaxID=890055 RepID=A0ABS6X9I4_9BACT|nr:MULTISPECIES: hypothetical protein [Pontibacter]MBJ6117772.1 hypothetical protein [Pontibacter sp. BT310]MBR0570198.1 hypothetical protein [Microvirga sp. STS03]MBW3364624.1 hypothetical protein [Pontibacter populi]
MHRFTSYIAVLLLLLFTRAMVPDALLLELHPHTHTVHADYTDSHKAQVGQKHKHCPVEDIFDVPFQGTITTIDLTPAQHHTVYANYNYSNWQNNNSQSLYLRGPPVV